MFLITRAVSAPWPKKRNWRMESKNGFADAKAGTEWLEFQICVAVSWSDELVQMHTFS